MFKELDIYDLFEKMERNKIMLSFKGEVTSELLTSILQIMERKLDDVEEQKKMRKKVFNILVECLQNLYHHIDSLDEEKVKEKDPRSAIFMIAKDENTYKIITGNFIQNENVDELKERLEKINSMDKEELKNYYKTVLHDGELSDKGGGGLGMIDIARKSGEKLEYDFMPLNDKNSFFSLNINITQN
ncbi:MAG: SiaB family protein kinase [Flavobacteriales bacterium]